MAIYRPTNIWYIAGSTWLQINNKFDRCGQYVKIAICCECLFSADCWVHDILTICDSIVFHNNNDVLAGLFTHSILSASATRFSGGREQIQIKTQQNVGSAKGHNNKNMRKQIHMAKNVIGFKRLFHPYFFPPLTTSWLKYM